MAAMLTASRSARPGDVAIRKAAGEGWYRYVGTSLAQRTAQCPMTARVRPEDEGSPALP